MRSNTFMDTSYDEIHDIVFEKEVIGFVKRVFKYNFDYRIVLQWKLKLDRLRIFNKLSLISAIKIPTLLLYIR